MKTNSIKDFQDPWIWKLKWFSFSQKFHEFSSKPIVYAFYDASLLLIFMNACHVAAVPICLALWMVHMFTKILKRKSHSLGLKSLLVDDALTRETKHYFWSTSNAQRTNILQPYVFVCSLLIFLKLFSPCVMLPIFGLTESQFSISKSPPKAKKRLQSLDAFRG